MIEQYRWAGGSEAMLRFGPAGGPVVLVAPPLFEEANRTRAFLVATLRALAARGIASVLPDLPGQGESPEPTEDARLANWRVALAAAAEAVGAVAGTVAVRAGALIDRDVRTRRRWQLAPIDGAALVRELWRIRVAASEDAAAAGTPPHFGAGAPPVAIAGNRIAPLLLGELMPATASAATPTTPLRVVRLDGDPRPADRKLPGVPLWRRSEPGHDQPLSQAVAADIAEWVTASAG